MEKIKAAVSMELWPEQLKELESCCDVKILPWTATDILPTEEEIIEECSGCEAVLFYTDPVTERVIRELKEKGLKLIAAEGPRLTILTRRLQKSWGSRSSTRREEMHIRLRNIPWE